MVIVVEGPDGAGKTTLVNDLSKKLAVRGVDTTVSHHGPYPEIQKSGDLARQYFLTMTRSLSYDDVSILDRSWYSEPIYSRVYRDQPSRLKQSHVRMLERASLSRGRILVVCRPSLETCAEVFGKRDEYIDEGSLEAVYHGYDELCSEADILYNRDEQDLDVIVGRIIKMLDATPDNIFGGGGNFIDPDVLVLCGKWTIVNVGRQAIVVPYLGFHNGPSPSVLLSKAFEEVGIPESSMFWVNTQDGDNKILSHHIMDVYDPKLVVAVGPLPEQWCKNNGVSCVALPQPKTGSSIDMKEINHALLSLQAKGVL